MKLERPLLSILIPVYNASLFLKRCLDSIFKETSFLDNIEVVIIDDGSSDDSLIILQEYAKDYSMVKLRSRKNLGIGPTRNELITKVSGSYFWFVDADDYISPNALSLILPLLEKGKYDMLLLSYFWGNERNGQEIIYVGEYDSGLDMALHDVYNNSLWSRVYRTEVVRNSHIGFRHFRMGEDFDFIFRLIPFLGRIKCIEVSLYNYMMNPGSAVFSKDINHRIQASEDSLTCLEYSFNFLRQLSKQERNALRRPLNGFLLGYVYSVYFVSFPLRYKFGVVNRLRRMKALPIMPLPPSFKHKIVSIIFNCPIIRELSLIVVDLINR